MKIALLAMLLLVMPALQQSSEPARFEAVDVFVNTHALPLAAWQVDFSADTNEVRIVGIEGGAKDSVFAAAPYYDPKAIQNDHAILAAFSTADVGQLPRGKSRVATIHLLIRGDARPKYEVTLAACADASGATIDAVVTLEGNDPT